MEYTGKPSTACLPCRQKRRKISLMRSSFPCSSFSDWSIAVIMPSQDVRNAPARTSTVLDMSQTGTYGSEMRQPFSLKEPVNGKPIRLSSVQHHRRRILKVLQQSMGDTYPSSTLQVILQQPAQNALITTIRAASLAALARRHQSQGIIGMALREFSTALAQTNASLANPNTATLNQTIGAVLALGLFELIVFTGKGAQQFSDLLGRRMCIHAAYNIRISCINRAVDVPEDLIKLEEQLNYGFNLPRIFRDHYSIMNRTLALFNATGAPPLVMAARWLFGMSMLRLVLIESIWSGSSINIGHSEILQKLNAIEGGISSDNNLAGDGRSRLTAYAQQKIVQIPRTILALAPRFLNAQDINPRFPKMARRMILHLAFIQSCPCCPSDIRQEATDILMRLEKGIELSQAQFAANLLYQ
ncbi:hypothetical protein H9L39_18547 [Fusarium oxysporum f. sp. albedinis]|nr:hypothetical protein H9L39_18547 [Fusarium oxysporum f. sp. albedinis]